MSLKYEPSSEQLYRSPSAFAWVDLSLYFSLTHTPAYTHIHAHSLTPSQVYRSPSAFAWVDLSLFLSLSLSHKHTHTHGHTLTGLD